MPIDLPIGRYRFLFEAQDHVSVRAFAGSAWRGAFGGALKRTVCALGGRDCNGCPLVEACAFPFLFEGRQRADAGFLSANARVPPPFTLEPEAGDDRVVRPGGHVALVFTLVGRANRSLPYVVHAIRAAAGNGIGPGRGRLRLVDLKLLDGIERNDGAALLDDEGGCRVRPVATPTCPPIGPGPHRATFVTPLRLKADGALVTPEGFRMHHLAGAVVRRVSNLAALYGGGPVVADFRELKAMAAAIRTGTCRLRWDEQSRYSGRQRTVMQMGGLVGEVAFDLPEEAAALGPWLAIGQWVGAGKGTSMGLGTFRIRPQAIDAAA